MDERLQEALEVSNYRLNLFKIKEDIKLKVEYMLLYAANGGLFKISMELITFTKVLLDANKTSAILLDSNQNPINIPDLKTFHEEILNLWFEATNFFSVEYNKVKSAKSTQEQFFDVKLGD